MRSLFAGIAAALFMAGPVVAQEQYPTRPITIVSPYPPGGAADLTARPLAPALERALKQSVVVVNKPGAGGAVGTQSVAIAPADGYTLLLTVFSISTIPEADRQAGRTPTFTRDQFIPIARLNADPTLIMVGASQPWKTLKDLVEDAKKRPGQWSYGTSGIGTTLHLGTELLKLRAGIDLVHVPYRGNAPAMTDLLAGRVQMMFPTLAEVMPFLHDGRLQALAVGYEQRVEWLPVPLSP